MKKTRKGYLDIATDKCVGCGKCAAACPEGVFRMKETDGKIKSVSIWSTKCTGCRLCSEVCSAKAIEVEVWTMELVPAPQKQGCFYGSGNF